MKDITRDILNKRFSGKKKHSARSWLVFTTCTVVGLLSLYQIVFVNRSQGSHEPSSFGASLSKTVTKPAKKTSPSTTKLPKQPALSVWRGQVKPIQRKPGPARVISKVPTKQPVVFLTIDDGVTQTPETLSWLTMHHLPISLFLYNNAVKDDYPYFRRLQTFGLLIENHTLSHPQMTELSLDQQKAEICGAADTYAKVFARRPTLFRPPYALYNDDTRVAAAACGMHAIVMWDVVIDSGAMQYQSPNTHLAPGDIVLMHFKPNFMADIRTFSAQVEKDHLQVARLEDWLK